MKFGRSPHAWNVSPKTAIATQKRLANQVIVRRLRGPCRFIAGADLAFSPDGMQCIAGVVVWDAVKQVTVEESVAIRPVRFPYVPGLLSFREAPALLVALRKIERQPDALICDGHGRAHPRRFGIACHMGVIVGICTIGCGKSRLTGSHEEPESMRGAWTRLLDQDAVIGRVVRTRSSVRCVYVSVGHLVDLDSAMRLVLRCAVSFRLPEPTRLADRLVARHKRLLASQTNGSSPLPLTAQKRARN